MHVRAATAASLWVLIFSGLVRKKKKKKKRNKAEEHEDGVAEAEVGGARDSGTSHALPRRAWLPR